MTPNVAPTAKRATKIGGYSNAKLHAKRNRKRDEADRRQEKYDGLTLADKLKTLVPGGSKRQRTRLEAQQAAINASKKTPTKKA
jgi:hypothetical protein